MTIVRQDAPRDEDRADQMARCEVCGYDAAGRDPVREVIYGTDGPQAVLATALSQGLPADRRKVLAFVDSRQEAAYFAWYLEDTYRVILSRVMILESLRRLAAHSSGGASLPELAAELRRVLAEKGMSRPSAGQLESRREAWQRVYQELLADQPRISLEGVGLLKVSGHVPSSGVGAHHPRGLVSRPPPAGALPPLGA